VPAAAASAVAWPAAHATEAVAGRKVLAAAHGAHTCPAAPDAAAAAGAKAAAAAAGVAPGGGGGAAHLHKLPMSAVVLRVSRAVMAEGRRQVAGA
jgi:hypothetical protein